MIDRLWQELRFAARSLLKSRGLSAVVVITLALALGATTAIFSLMDQALLRSLPVAHPNKARAARSRGVNRSVTRWPSVLDENTVLGGVKGTLRRLRRP